MTKTNKIEVAVFALGCACLISQSFAENAFLSSPQFESRIDPEGIPLSEPESDDWAFALKAGWSSKYVTEGIDCLPGSGIWEVAPSIGYGDFSLSAWYAGGVSEHYDELDIVLGYQWQLGDFTINPWYEHQFYFDQDYNVNNPAVTVTYAINDWLNAGVEGQVKFEHQVGEAYYSAFIQATWQPFESVSVSPLIRYGYNGGYNTGVADGSNCIDYSLAVSWEFAENCTLSGSVNYSQALTVLRRDDLGDAFWAGIHVGYEF